MKINRDLHIRGTASELAEARRRLSGVAAIASWQRDEVLAARVPTIDATVFTYSGESAPEAHVWLTWGEDSAEVSNIVPSLAGSLTYDEYNGIAALFDQEVLRPSLGGLAVKIELGPCDEHIGDLLSKATVDALRAFSHAANKSTGTAHPNDAGRWQRFVILAHIEDASLDSEMLQRWLCEDEGWGDDEALDLAIQYERARSLLSRYDDERGA